MRITAALFLVATALPAAALDPSLALTQYRRDTWTTREGLPQSSVEAIAQTPDGYLWLGTQEGLARFDGLRFTVYDKASTPNLHHNRVTALLAARDGSLWIGTEGGGVTRRLASGVFDHVEGLSNLRVRALAQDAGGAIWAGTDAGLARFQGAGFVAGNGAERLDQRGVSALRMGHDGLWVGLRDGLVQIGPGVIAPVPVGALAGSVTSLWEDADRTLWLGSVQGLFVRRPGSADVEPYTVPLANPHVTTILRDSAGTLWIGTDAGATRVTDRGATVAGPQQGFTSDRILQILEDREGGILIGMQDGGLTRLAAGKFTTWSAVEGLAGDIAWPVFGARDGSLWIGTKTGGLSHLRDGRFETLSTKQGLSADAVQSVAEGRDGALWIGTRSGGLNRLQGGRVTKFGAREGITSDSVSALLVDRAGRLWVGTRNGALCQMENDRCVAWGGSGVALGTSAIHAIVEGRDGSLWVATNGGGLVHLKDGEKQVYKTRDGLSSDIVNIVHEDAEGTLWIGTYGGGLNRMRGDRFTAYTTSQGLYDDAIFSILEDSRGRLWMSCNKGVFRVDKQELDDLDRGVVTRLHPVAYGVEDGMKDRECNGANFPPAWKDRDGRLWFPTIEGVASVDPEHLPVNTRPLSVNLEQVVVDGRSEAPRDGLVLGPGARNVEFHYAAPSFVVPGRVRYRYRLEGLDPDWVDAGARRVAYYSRLPPGRFRFRVAAANEDGVWNEEGASLALRRTPRLYQTPWFAAACALALGAAVWSGDRIRTRRRAAREAALEGLVEERTRDLAEANLRLERLSALDGLTGVANRRRFDDVLGVEWRRGCRSGEPLSLILMDLDFFKPFNDTNGHLAGDEALRQVAGYLSGTLGRAGDLVARFGGEEFVALLPGMPKVDAAALAERLRAGVFGLALPHNASPVANVVTLSAGVATVVPEEQESPQTLVATADAALYKAKRDGRNVVKVAS
jgi:diguanylate cyclase (GGDEF)-like protein